MIAASCSRAGRALALAAALVALAAGCGPVPRPEGAFEAAPDLLAEMAARRDAIESLRAAGRVDHFGEKHRVAGKAFVFLERPRRLRIDLLSPFGSTLAVLTVDGDDFALADFRENRFFEGPAEPCNLARLVQVPLPPEDAARVLIGDTPVIDGARELEWLDEGRYRVTVRDGERVQRLDIDPDERVLALRRSRLEDGDGVVFDLSFDRWRPVGPGFVPHEIRVEMPREQADLLLRYDEGEVEANAALPADAWRARFPAGAVVEPVSCR